MGVALIIILIICLFWPVIMRWLQRFMAHRAEDMVRRMAGMPSRKEEKRRRKQQARQAASSSSSSYGRGQSSSRHHHGNGDGMRAMKEYAEDVSFTEICEYSSEEVIGGDGTHKNRRIYREEQVSDAEFVEIKTEK